MWCEYPSAQHVQVVVVEIESCAHGCLQGSCPAVAAVVQLGIHLLCLPSCLLGQQLALEQLNVKPLSVVAVVGVVDTVHHVAQHHGQCYEGAAVTPLGGNIARRFLVLHIVDEIVDLDLQLLYQCNVLKGEFGVSSPVMQLLYQDIISLQLSPGTKLNTNQIASQLGISRTPVSEAIAGLAEMGFEDISEINKLAVAFRVEEYTSEYTEQPTVIGVSDVVEVEF